MTTSHRNHAGTLGLIVAAGIILLVPIVRAGENESTDLDDLASWMAGTFSSAVQAAEDPDFFAVSLHMAPIWTDRSDGSWLYLEQAVSEEPHRPYRQRVYRLVELAPGLFETQVFTLPDPGAVIGVWISDDPLAALSPDDLEERDGCAILLRRRDDSFIGSTLASLCAGTLRGAAYATSEVIVTPDGIVSWDRGFADDGSQVWGAIKGGYVFDRIVADDLASESGAETESDSDSEGNTEGPEEVMPETASQPE
jgi:CpeT protein